MISYKEFFKRSLCFLWLVATVLCFCVTSYAANSGTLYHDDIFIRVGLYFGDNTAGFYKMTSEDGFSVIAFDEQSQEFFISQTFSCTEATATSDGSVVSVSFASGEVVTDSVIYIAALDFDSEEKPTISVPSGKSFHGMLRFTAENSRLSVTNILRLEDYIKGVLPNEVVPSWEHECLKTSAVAARTFALSTINGKHSGYKFDVCNTICCQVYVGEGTETEATNNAVDETKAEILTYNGKIISAVYHSSSGGATESAAGAWGGSEETHPYLTVVETPFEKYEEYPGGSWTATATAKEIFEYVNSKGAYAGKLRNTIERIDYTPGPSGYIRSVTLYDPYGNSLIVKTSSSIYSLFSKFVKSANFVISVGEENTNNTSGKKENSSQQENTLEGSEKVYVMTASGLKTLTLSSQSKVMTSEGINSIGISAPERKPVSTDTQSAKLGSGKVTFIGKGFGHGVGLSQYGSQELAKMGKTYDEILATYYPGALLTNIASLNPDEDEDEGKFED